MIPEIRKILYVTDLSKNSAYAFNYAVGMADKNESTIVILHVVEPLPSFGIGFKDFREMVEDDRKDKALEEIEKRRKAINQFANSDIHKSVSNIIIRIGDPVEEILKLADEEKYDVIILGIHEKGFLTQTFLGSVCDAVLHRIRKPIFIIPLPLEETKID
jgi:nucleotide-binding universal stress UspA family protein